MSTAVRSFMTWAAGVLLTTGVLLIVVAMALFYDDRSFARDARTVEGTVLTKQVRSSGSSRSGSRAKKHEITYRFTIEGRTLDGRDTLSRDA